MDIAEEIYVEREQGATYAELSKKYEISVAACRKRYEAGKKKCELRKNEIFLALQAVNEDEARNVRVFNMLKRSGIDTVEQFITLAEQNFRKLRDCGDLSAKIIMLAQIHVKTMKEAEEETI